MEGHVMEVEASFMSHDWKDDRPFKDNLLAMMRQARGGGHMGWLLDNENDQFLAACGAALLKCSEEDRTWLKSQLEAVEFGLRTFEDVFMSDIQMSQDGRTIGDYVRGAIAAGRLALPAEVK
jgi:hypothetical protein